MNPLNPLTQMDLNLLTDNQVEIEIDQANLAAPTGVIIFNQRRFKVSILNQPGAGGVLVPTEEQMRVTANKVAVMLLKKELLQQPQAQPLDLKINRQGMTLQNDNNRLIQHIDAVENKNTKPDYDALANYLTAPLPQPDAEIEKPEAAANAANLDLVVHEHQHSQVPPNYITVNPLLAAYIKENRNPFLDPRFELAPRNGQRLALMNGQQHQLAEQEKDVEIFMDPNVLRVIVEGWEAEAEEERRLLQGQQERRVLIQEITEEEAEAIQSKKPTDALDPQSSAIISIPHPISSASAQRPYYHPAYLLLPPQMRANCIAGRVLGMNGVFLDPATRAALSLRRQPLTLTAAPQAREEAKTEQSATKDEPPVVTAHTKQPVKAEDESEVSDLRFTDLTKRRSIGFDWIKSNNSQNPRTVPNGLFDRNAFGRNPFEPMKDPFKSFNQQPRRFQTRSFPRSAPNAPTKNPKPAPSPSPAKTTPPVVPAPAPLMQPPPPQLSRVYTDPTLVQLGNEEATFNYHLKEINSQSGPSKPLSSFFPKWSGFGKPQSNTQS